MKCKAGSHLPFSGGAVRGRSEASEEGGGANQQGRVGEHQLQAAATLQSPNQTQASDASPHNLVLSERQTESDLDMSLTGFQ